MSRFITQKEQDDLDNMLCEQFRKRKKPKFKKRSRNMEGYFPLCTYEETVKPKFPKRQTQRKRKKKGRRKK